MPWDEACRYEDNGLLGYLAPDGSELAPAIFIEASKLSEGKARVREASGGVYYIDSSCKRISADYIDGFEYEHQGCYARVQLKDKTWGILDRRGNLIFEGADSIQPLPYFTVFGGALMNNKACLFQLDTASDDKITIINTFDEFCEISEVEFGLFASVVNKEGMVGVVDYTGNILIPARYKAIDYEVTFNEKYPWIVETGIFHCYEDNGEEKIIEKRWFGE